MSNFHYVIQHVHVQIRPDFQVEGETYPINVTIPTPMKFGSTAEYNEYIDNFIKKYFPWALSWDYKV